MAERAVRPMLIIVEPPGFNDVLGLGHRSELVPVQTLVSQAAVTGFNSGMLHGFARPNAIEWDASVIA
jgi:hypothetical protein